MIIKQQQQQQNSQLIKGKSNKKVQAPKSYQYG